MSRKTIARWLIQKLLGGLSIYVLIFWAFPILKIEWKALHFYEFYAWITTALIIASAISYILLPPELKIKDKLKFWKTREKIDDHRSVCKFCGSSITINSTFCSKCGKAQE